MSYSHVAKYASKCEPRDTGDVIRSVILDANKVVCLEAIVFSTDNYFKSVLGKCARMRIQIMPLTIENVVAKDYFCK